MAAALLFGAAQLAAAAVAVLPERTLDFDDLAGLVPLTASNVIADGYGAFTDSAISFAGFEWDLDRAGLGDIAAFDRRDATLSPFGAGYAPGVTSGNNAALNFGGAQTTAIVSAGGEFVFRGARFTGAFNPAVFGLGPQSLTIEGRLGDNLVHTATLGIDHLGPQTFSVDWHGIDRVVVTTQPALQWVMDDFRYTVAVVPEPSTFALLLSGLVLFAFVRRP